MKKKDRRKIFKDPLFYLLIPAAVVFVMILVLPGFDYETTQDSKLYMDFFNKEGSGLEYIRNVFNSVRTIGYPVFLAVIYNLAGSYESVPIMQYSIHVVAVLIFYNSLIVFGFREWPAFFAAAPLMASIGILSNVRYIMSDSIGLSFAVMSVSLLLMALAKPKSKLMWGVTALMLFVTCQVRPAYLFMLPLFPLLAFILWYLRTLLDEEKAVPSVSRIAAYAILACFIPFFAFCSLRKVVTGQFGYTVFGGINIIGITGQLLSYEIVDDLSSDLQPFARKILKIRRETETLNPGIPDYWKDRKEQGWGVYYYLRKNYNPCIYKLFSPNAEWGLIERNNKFTKLSMQIIKLKTKSYLRIVYDSYLDAIVEYMALQVRNSIRFKLYLVGALLSFVLFVLHFGSRRPGASIESEDAKKGIFEVGSLVIIAVSFFLVNNLLVALVEIPISRYHLCMGVFVPCVICILIIEPWMLLKKSNVSSSGENTQSAD